jgi:hypothetical protein
LRKLLIGPVLTGAGWLAGSHYGAQAQQIVHKSPSATYDGVSHALDNMRQSGTTHFEGAHRCRTKSGSTGPPTSSCWCT